MAFRISSRLADIHYAIRDVVLEADKVEKAGKKIIRLNIGDPLKYDFDLPSELKGELAKAVSSGYNYYGDSIGEKSTREAIAFKEKAFNKIDFDPSNVMVGNGVSEVFLLISSVLFENGEEILIPGPSYPIYTAYPRLFGGKAVEYRCDEDKDWQPDIDDIRKKVNKKTAGIVLINPNNPTGAVYDEKTVKAIVEIARENKLLVFSDEIYDHNMLEGEFKSTARIVKDYPIIGLNGISKSYLATGWRMGYMYIANPDGAALKFKGEVAKVARARLCPVLPVQKASEILMRKEPLAFKEINDKYRKRRDYMTKRLSEIPGISVVKPKGAFYIFPKLDLKGELRGLWKDDRDFVYSLLRETGVLTVFGSGFGEYGSSHFRAVYLPPVETIEEAMVKTEDFIKKAKSKGSGK